MSQEAAGLIRGSGVTSNVVQEAGADACQKKCISKCVVRSRGGEEDGQFFHSSEGPLYIITG